MTMIMILLCLWYDTIMLMLRYV